MACLSSNLLFNKTKLQGEGGGDFNISNPRYIDFNPSKYFSENFLSKQDKAQTVVTAVASDTTVIIRAFHYIIFPRESSLK